MKTSGQIIGRKMTVGRTAWHIRTSLLHNGKRVLHGPTCVTVEESQRSLDKSGYQDINIVWFMRGHEARNLRRLTTTYKRFNIPREPLGGMQDWFFETRNHADIFIDNLLFSEPDYYVDETFSPRKSKLHLVKRRLKQLCPTGIQVIRPRVSIVQVTDLSTRKSYQRPVFAGLGVIKGHLPQFYTFSNKGPTVREPLMAYN